MKSLKVRCPRCKETLELDPGFAGGVCRCSYCRALMSVPGEKISGRRSRQQRVNRPDVPMGQKVPPDAEDTRNGTSLFGFTFNKSKKEDSEDTNGSKDVIYAEMFSESPGAVDHDKRSKWWLVVAGVVLVVLAMLGLVAYQLILG